MAKKKSPAKEIKEKAILADSPEFKQSVAVTLKQLGKSYAKIGKFLGVTRQTAFRWVKAYEQGNHTEVTTDIINQLKPMLIKQDLDLLTQVTRRMKRELRDKENKVTIDQLVTAYQAINQNIIPIQTKGGNSGVAIQINTTPKEYSIGTIEN